jgi:DNA-binding transcriptional MerR regulator
VSRPPLATTSDIARAYSVNPATVRKWVADDRIHPARVTLGGHYRFDPEQVESDLAKAREQTETSS